MASLYSAHFVFRAVLMRFQLDAVVEHNPLDGHTQHHVQFAGTRRQRRWQTDHLAVPSVCRRIVDSAMRRLLVHIDDPLVQHLAKRAQQNYSVPSRVVVVTLRDVAESGSRVAVHQVVTHRALEPFQLALVPGH
jgi:hypothetical protein